MKEQIKEIIRGHLHTIGCGVCQNNKTNICKYCSVKDSTRIMWKIKDEYLDEMVQEIEEGVLCE